MPEAVATYTLKDWNENSGEPIASGGKVSHVSAVFTFSGALEGETKTDMLLQYLGDKPGNYAGWERFSGTFLGKPGEVLLRHMGTFDAKNVDVEIQSVPDSGSGSLEGVTLHGTIHMKGHGPYEFRFQFE